MALSRAERVSVTTAVVAGLGMVYAALALGEAETVTPEVWARAETGEGMALLAVAARRPPVTERGEPVVMCRVVDGNTVGLTDGRKVRLLGIDAAETWERTEAGGWRRVDPPDPRAEDATATAASSGVSGMMASISPRPSSPRG